MGSRQDRARPIYDAGNDRGVCYCHVVGAPARQRALMDLERGLAYLFMVLAGGGGFLFFLALERLFQ